MKTRLLIMLFVAPVAGCGSGAMRAPDSRIRSVSEARQRLERQSWWVEEFGGGTRLFARRGLIDKDKAMNAFARGIRKELDGVVLIAPVDSGELLPGLVSKQVDEVWILGEAQDVEMCMRDLRR
jgi:hypothetical protein